MQAQGTRQDRRRLEKTSTPGIYKRVPRGGYVVIVKLEGRQLRRYAKTLAEARALKSQLTADRDRGELRPSLSREPFEEYARGWIESYAGRTSRGFRERTREQYRDSIERHAVPHFGRRRLSEITPPDVKDYVSKLATGGLSYNSVRIAVAPLRAMLADAFEDGLIRSNPAAGVRIARQVVQDADEERAKALTPEELQRLLAEIPEEHRLVVEFLVATGLRVGEAAGLRWADIDLGTRRVKVRRTLQRDRKAKTWTTTPPKTKFGVRDVPVSALLAQRLWQARKDAGDPSDDAYVFAGPRGAPLDAVNGFNRILKPAARRAGVPWAGWHTLRHTAATAAFRHGWNPKQVQRLLGHHAASFTIDRYVHLLTDDLPEPTFVDEFIGRPVDHSSAEPNAPIEPGMRAFSAE